jgi:DNA transposition AAA+ family ATPase
MNDQGSAGRSNDAREALIDRERIRGANRMISEGTDAAKVTAEQIAAVAEDVKGFVAHHKITRQDLARSIGYSSSVVVEFLKGTYAGNRGEVAIQLDSWLSEEETRRRRPQTTQFVWTNIAMEMKATANYCLDEQTIGLVYGPDTSGIGKTMALQAIHQEIGPRRSTLITIDKVDANPTGLLKKILRGLRKDDKGSTNQRFGRVVEELTGRNHLLIIDQIHNLRFSKDDKPFYILADLWDATKDTCAQLWCGTADLVNYLERQRKRSADESLAQIRRRIWPRVDLMETLRTGGSDGGGGLLVTVEQVKEMFARNKLKITAASARWLCAICNQPDSGAVGLCVQIIRYATMMAEIKNLPCLDVPLLQQALRKGFSPKGAENFLHRMDLFEQPRSVAKVG